MDGTAESRTTSLTKSAAATGPWVDFVGFIDYDRPEKHMTPAQFERIKAQVEKLPPISKAASPRAPAKKLLPADAVRQLDAAAHARRAER